MTQDDYIKVPKSGLETAISMIREADPRTTNVMILYLALARDIIRMYEEQT